MRAFTPDSIKQWLSNSHRIEMRFLLAAGLAFMLVFSQSVFSQAGQGTFISGTVVDKDTKQPMVKASVSVPSLRLGAVTDNKGSFKFAVPAGEHTVEAKYIGYQTGVIRVIVKENETKTVKFDMSVQAVQANQIVVVGLTGEVDRNQLGNVISSVGASEIANVVSPSAIDAISGRVPGVNVTRNSGTPGAGTYITMRGRKSILGSSEPLYVVDGVIIDNTSLYDGSGEIQFANRAVDINPQDIESMEILKGASAAAIYGSQAANGVVLITTKKGKISSYDKPAQITFTSSLTSDSKYGSIPLQTKYGQTTPFKEGVPGSTTSWGAELPAGTTTYAQDDVPFRTALSAENSLTISGGSPQFDYLINGTYSSIQGYVIGSGLDKTNIRANIGLSLLPGVTLQTNNNFITLNNDLPQDGSNTSGILLGALRTPPEFNTAEYLYADGTQRRFASYDNPLWTQNFNTFNSNIARFIHGTDLRIRFFNWLTFNTRIGYDRYEYINKSRLAVGSAGSANRAGEIGNSRITNEKMNLDFTATFQDRFMDDQLQMNFILGSQTIWNDRTSNFASSTNTVPFYDEVAAGAEKDGGSSTSRMKTIGVFGQLTTTYLDKLSLTLALRRDGSSTFGEAKQFHFYPKVGLSYTLSEEEFWKPMKETIDNFRIRASWGEAGSPSLPYEYATNFLYGSAGFFDPWGRETIANRSNNIGIKPGGGTTSASFVTAGSTDISPELSIEREFGLDLGFLGGMFGLEFTYYHTDIKDMILNVPVPTSTGFDQQLRNAAEMWNKGFEIALRATPINTEDLTWSLTLNYSTNTNEVTKLEVSPMAKDGEYITLGGGFVGINNIAMKGQPLGIFWGYGWLKDENGNIVHSGDKIKVDASGSWVRNEQGRVIRDDAGAELGDDYGLPYVGTPIQDPNMQIIGDSNPDFQFSWRNDLTFFKDFTLSFLWDAVIGFDVWNGTRGALYNFGTHGDTEDRMDNWVNERGDQVMDMTDPANPKPANKVYFYRYHSNGFYINEPHVQDGSYIKLRELTLEYRWDGLKEWNIGTIAFNFSARNLLTITDYTGFDPEVNTFSLAEGRGYDYFTLPQIQSYRFGISINY